MKNNLKLVCPKCGTPHQPHSPHTMDADGFERCEIRTVMEDRGWCYECSFWQNMYDKHKDDPGWVRIDGESWVLKPMVENVPSGWNSLGCGGRKMYINIEGKGIVTSNNCWCQGDVSDAFKDLMPDNGNYLGIDIGLDNLASCVSNNGSCFIINGRPLKSINQYYNKRLAFLKSKLKDNKQISKQIRSLTNKRNNKIKDYLHKASRILINHVVSNGINTIIIGHNKYWKQEINIGKRNNQNFVSIPFNMFISMISYKATLEGVNVKIVEESYTSKCSFLDNERICKHESYKGRRTKRGLFKTSFGKIINADINGAFNIIRKSEKESFDVTMLPKGTGFWWNPVRISV